MKVLNYHKNFHEDPSFRCRDIYKMIIKKVTSQFPMQNDHFGWKIIQ